MPVHRLPLRNVYPLFPAHDRSAILKPVWHAVDSANFAMARDFGRLVDRVRPAIVHTHNVTGFSPLVWSAASRRGIPIVHTLHDHYLLCVRSTMFFRGKNCTSRHFACALYSAARLHHSSKVAAVVGVSRFILERHLAFGAFPKASIRRIIRNPMFAVPNAGRTANSGTLRIGYLGRLESAKGIDLLLGACAALPRSEWSLDIGGVGLPTYEAEIRTRFAHPNVRFLGQVDAATFLRSVDVLAVPSRSNEALPMVIAEAYASGVPVVASRVGGIPEIVDEGRTGFLVPPESPRELMAALDTIARTPTMLQSMRDACLAAASQFAPDVIAREYADVYAALTGRVVERSSAPLAKSVS